ncbi:MAG: hypothetical protein H5U37_01470 [Caldisericia bacterium]|nr:hypothetical protein [Caldisericia bacterium]
MEDYSPPSLIRYRKIQVATKLIEFGFSIKDFIFDKNNNLIKIPHIERENLKKLNPFITRGCPYCTRPYYNERPKGDLYNYPYNLSEEEFEKEYELLINSGLL